jgi:hypothetical protein
MTARPGVGQRLGASERLGEIKLRRSRCAACDNCSTGVGTFRTNVGSMSHDARRRRCSSLLDAARRCSTLLVAARRCSTLLDAARRCSTLLRNPSAEGEPATPSLLRRPASHPVRQRSEARRDTTSAHPLRSLRLYNCSTGVGTFRTNVGSMSHEQNTMRGAGAVAAPLLAWRERLLGRELVRGSARYNFGASAAQLATL